MELYYVATYPKANRDHEVHRAGCQFMPMEHGRYFVGRFGNSFDALREARRHYIQSNGCASCLPECHLR